jgi:ketosteroid isomerase-like protein
VSTREAVLEHVAAFNAHDTDRVLAGLHPDVVRATGTDVFRGSAQLRAEVLDDGLWALHPSLAVRTLLVEGDTAAAVLHETLDVDGEPRTFGIAVVIAVGAGLICTVQVFREGTADIHPPAS